MSEFRDRVEGFVAHLRRFTEPGHENRGALADLRSGLGKEPGEAPRMHKHVVPYLGEHIAPSDRWFYVAAAVFGAHPVHEQGRSFGECFRQLRQQGSESIENRFLAILASHPEDLPKHLAGAAGLLESANRGIDYVRLILDLVNWDAADRRVQNRWAREFYGSKPENAEGGTKNE